MSLSIRATCDACKKLQAEEGAPSVVDERGAVAVTPPRGWFAVASRGPGSPTAAIELACSSACATALVQRVPLEAPLAKNVAELDKAITQRGELAAPMRRNSKVAAPLPVLPVPRLATVRVLGPFAGNQVLAPLGEEFMGDVVGAPPAATTGE